MNQKQFRRWRKLAVLMIVSFLILPVIGSRWSSSTAAASSVNQSTNSIGTTAEMTDAISVALDLAESSGLIGEPDEMYISKGVYSEFMPPGTLESSYADHTVWVVWFKAEFLFNGISVSNFPVDNLYIYIDANTGLPFERLAGKSSVEEFSQKPWTKVSKSDIGKFPIPKFASGAGAEVLPLKPTATPAK